MEDKYYQRLQHLIYHLRTTTKNFIKGELATKEGCCATLLAFKLIPLEARIPTGNQLSVYLSVESYYGFPSPTHLAGLNDCSRGFVEVADYLEGYLST